MTNEELQNAINALLEALINMPDDEKEVIKFHLFKLLGMQLNRAGRENSDE